MSLRREMKQKTDFTEREQDICKYILEHPEAVKTMSSRELGAAAFSSAAAVTRFCKKMGCKGYPDFKLRFCSEMNMKEEQEGKLEIAKRENVVSTLQKTWEIHERALNETRNEISLEQMVRVREMVHKAEYIDFYAYDNNVYLSQYGCSQLFHCGKIANTYTATNIQELMALKSLSNHLAIIITQTGENSRLIAIAKILRKRKVKTIIITTGRDKTISNLGDEMLFAAGADENRVGIDAYWSVCFSASVKFVLDLIFGMEFSYEYEKNMKLNEIYEDIGEKNFWGLKKKINRKKKGIQEP